MTLQASSSVIRVRPHAFQSSPQTRADNAFQTASARDPFDAAGAPSYNTIETAGGSARCMIAGGHPACR